jgi:hypothetical protein
MAHKKIETIVKEKISPYTLNERGIADLAQLVRQYPYELLLECIDIGVASYFQYDKEGNLLYEEQGDNGNSEGDESGNEENEVVLNTKGRGNKTKVTKKTQKAKTKNKNKN